MKKKKKNSICAQERPRFTSSGRLVIPPSVLLPGEARPKLSAREWLVLVWIVSEKGACRSETKIEKIRGDLCGHRATEWRTRKALEKKGYL